MFDNSLHNKRLTYYGEHALDRLAGDKLYSLHKALLLSYQSEIIELHDKVFRCLINPDKNKPDYDNKIISIPYNEPCMTTNKEEDTNIKVGDVFTWIHDKNDRSQDTHWLVYLKYLEEKAYFRAEIRRCDLEIEVNGTKYWAYIRGPVETQIIWNQKANTEWNDLNYSLVMYITKDDNTKDFFKRFAKVKIKDERTDRDQTWKVVSTNPYFGDGIIEVFLDEDHENPIQEARDKEIADMPQKPEDVSEISGPSEVTVFDTVSFNNGGYRDGYWMIDYNGTTKRFEKSDSEIRLNINFGKTGKFVLSYNSMEAGILSKEIKILPL